MKTVSLKMVKCTYVEMVATVKEEKAAHVLQVTLASHARKISVLGIATTMGFVCVRQAVEVRMKSNAFAQLVLEDHVAEMIGAIVMVIIA